MLTSMPATMTPSARTTIPPNQHKAMVVMLSKINIRIPYS